MQTESLLSIAQPGFNATLQSQEVDELARRTGMAVLRLRELRSWSQFYREFSSEYPDFLPRLLLKHPKLSDIEQRICVLTRCGLSCKETAFFLRMTPRSIEGRRSRIRKKLKVKGVDLTTYLLKF